MVRVPAFVAGLVCGLVLGSAVIIGHADDVQAEVLAAAAAAHVDPVRLQGAINSTGDDPWTYLRAVGELPAPQRSLTAVPASSARINCIIAHESQGDPRAYNRSGASGLGQFLPGTWASTPQGRAGLSVWDPAANTAAINYMLAAGRAQEFDAVRFYGC
jgi:hypothetical protein